MVQKHVGRAGAHGAAPSTQNRLRSQRTLHPVILKPLIEEVRPRDREESHHLGDILSGPMPQLHRRAQHFRNLTHLQIRRNDKEQIAHEVSDPVKVAIEFDVGLGILLRELSNRFGGLFRVAPENQGLAIGVGNEIIRVQHCHVVAVLFELQFIDYFLGHEAHHIGRG